MRQLLVLWMVSAFALMIVSVLVPGFHLEGGWAALKAAFIIGLVNGSLGVLVTVATLPLTVITFGLFLVVVNALMLQFSAWLVDGFSIDGFWWAVLGSIVLSVTNAVLRQLLFPRKKSNQR